ncbi:MAG: hypothetical protein ABL984_10270 [Pyrinomonadaceae bacterium]
MLAKIYVALWFAVAFAAGLIFLTGTFTMLTVVVFGFLTFGLVFTGMMCVLPYEVSHPQPAQIPASSEKQVARRPVSALVHLRAYGAELMTPNGVEIRKPKLH